jgi:hypothetical protein
MELMFGKYKDHLKLSSWGSLASKYEYWQRQQVTATSGVISSERANLARRQRRIASNKLSTALAKHDSLLMCQRHSSELCLICIILQTTPGRVRKLATWSRPI